MLSDYIPVYYPDTNQWSIPNYEIMKYKDEVPEPQETTLYEGHIIRGIPLVHFGTWGLLGVTNLGQLLRDFVEKPAETCAKCYKSKKAREDITKFFKALAANYPDMPSMTEYRDNNRDGLNVPAGCVVAEIKPAAKK